MKNFTLLSVLGLVLFFSACTDGDSGLLPGDDSKEYSADGDAGSSSSGNGTGNQGQSGLVTAGEWNDLSNWDFWTDLLDGQDYSAMPSYWHFYTNHRIAVVVENEGTPLINAKVDLLRNGTVVWSAKTDNTGSAELWVGAFQNENSIDLSRLSLKINDEIPGEELVLRENEVNHINFSSQSDESKRVEIAFIVDATGSMGDELSFLKADLQSVIDSVKRDDSDAEIYTSTVFYRDEGDDYVVRKSEFTNDLSSTIDFISQQRADGGGDFPEAVHTALYTGIEELQWSDAARTRIAFLLLDAPPHYTSDIVESINTTIKLAAQKGIKIIPITASGIDKETEFLMRFMAVLTNGTYVFITNDSGIGNDHIEASVGDYQVEYLNRLMIRLIKKYSE